MHSLKEKRYTWNVICFAHVKEKKWPELHETMKKKKFVLLVVANWSESSDQENKGVQILS